MNKKEVERIFKSLLRPPSEEIWRWRVEYKKLLKSGMFFEFHPELTGDWKQDKEQWLKIKRSM